MYFTSGRMAKLMGFGGVFVAIKIEAESKQQWNNIEVAGLEVSEANQD